MSVDRQSVLNMHRALQEMQDLPKIQQLAAQNPINQQQDPSQPPVPMQPPEQPQGQPLLHQDLQRTVGLIINLMNASIMRQDLNFDVQTNGIYTLSQAIQQLYASGHVEEIAQQHQMMLNEQDHANQTANQQAQLQLQGQQQAHQQAMDSARLQMEQAQHAQQIRQQEEMHKAKLLQLGHAVASDHEQQNVDTALKVQDQAHQQAMAEDQQQHSQQMAEKEAAKPNPKPSSK